MNHYMKRIAVRNPYWLVAYAALCAAWSISIATPAGGQEATVTILHSFGDGSVSNDGRFSYSGLIQATDGNFYGTTQFGGSKGQGTVFKISSAGAVTILHSFGDGSVTNDGLEPQAALVQGTDGNFYGTTFQGGTKNDGAVFEITPSGVVTILHSFGDGSVLYDGLTPQQAGLVQGSDGNFYGTTYFGGAGGRGTLFEITPQGQVTIVHSFGDGSVTNDGHFPNAGVMQATDGNIYGMTMYGGSANQGTIFCVTPAGHVTILHSFGDGSVPNDGDLASSSLMQATDGNLYGMTSGGGALESGTVFRITTSGQYTILHSFNDGSVPDDGRGPGAGLIQAVDGNFYGTTNGGGSANRGTVFSITSAGQVTILHSFDDGSVADDGAQPWSTLVLGSDGNFYGTTGYGGSTMNSTSYTTDPGDGTVFKLTMGSSSEPPPPPPTGLTATPAIGQVSLSWTASTEASTYNVYRSLTSGGEGTAPYQTGVTGTAFTDTAVANGTAYYYEVTAVNAGGESGKSNEASATPEPSVPAAPTGLTATGGNSQVVLSWTASTEATSYNVYRGTSSGAETLYQSGVTTTGYTDTAVVNDTTYFYEVTAVNGGGESGKSNEASAAPFEPIVLPAGLQMFSLPYGYSGVSLSALFGYANPTLAVWSQATDQYLLTPTPPANQISLGQGYWARFPQAVTISTPGTPAPTNQNFDIALTAGWNMIGEPFPFSTPITSLLFDNGTETFAQATTGNNPLIGATVWGYSPSANQYTAATTLAPEQGYWVFAFATTDVQVPRP